jgi:opacity protein-like surface antigen
MRKKMQTRLLLGLAALGAVCALHSARAQDIPAAQRGDLELGGTISIAKTGIQGVLTGTNGQKAAQDTIYGGSIYANFNVIGHIGLTAQFDYPDTHTSQDLLEKSYMVGARYYQPYHRFTPYVKGLVGLANISYDKPVNWITFQGTPGSYTALAVGGGLDYRLGHHITVRAIDVQLEDWLGFPGGSIHPTIVSFGLAYRIR